MDRRSGIEVDFEGERKGYIRWWQIFLLQCTRVEIGGGGCVKSVRGGELWGVGPTRGSGGRGGV